MSRNCTTPIGPAILEGAFPNIPGTVLVVYPKPVNPDTLVTLPSLGGQVIINGLTRTMVAWLADKVEVAK